MKARDVMVSPVTTVTPNASVRDAAKLLLHRHFSALPVVDDKGKLVGIISESDLMRRSETGTERHRSCWLRFIAGDDTLAAEYARAHAKRVGDVMTRKVVTAHPDTPLDDIAALLEKYGIKRVPLVSDGQLVGIVSRADLVKALANVPNGLEMPLSDERIRETLLTQLRAQPWSHVRKITATVHGGVVDLTGVTYSDHERAALRIAAENIPGVRAVNDHLMVRLPQELEI